MIGARILAADFSGARRARGIALALREGAATRLLVPPVGHRHWRRLDLPGVVERLAVEGPLRVLIDAPFSLPAEVLRLVVGEAPEAARWAALLGFVESAASGAADLYGRPAAEAPAWRERFYRGGPLQIVRPLRATERACQAAGLGRPWSAVDLHVQNAGVGALAAMRLLHLLKARLGAACAVWPFEDPDAPGVRVVVAEVFPRVFLWPWLGPRKAREAEDLHPLLRDAGAEAALPTRFDDHVGDALAVAASAPAAWTARPIALPALAREEGWILGVPRQPANSQGARSEGRRAGA